MAIDAVAPRTRRSLLAGAVGAAAATAASALGRPQAASATNGGTVLLGTSPSGDLDGTGPNEASATTAIHTTLGHGLYAETAATTGYASGLMGVTSSSGGNAVTGIATATTGYTAGVAGEAASDSGAATWGWAPLGTGAMGISGPTEPGSARVGTGVLGLATFVEGMASGVVGETLSPTEGAAGVIGRAMAGDGLAAGVKGETSSAVDQAAAVYGHASSAQGYTYGVYGQSDGEIGSGVYGFATATEPPVDSFVIGVEGSSAALRGSATWGWNWAGGTGAAGIVGEFYSPDGALNGPISAATAVYGNATDAVGTTVGVLGVVRSPSGTGVIGYAGANARPAALAKTAIHGRADQDATSRGVVGTTLAGTGVHGYTGAGAAPAPSAKTGVFGRSDVDAAARGVAGHSTAGSGIYGSTSTGKGVSGIQTGATGTAVLATAIGAGGLGVSASAAGATGIAVSASAANAAGYALKTSGRLSFAKVSGVATIAAGATASGAIATGTDVTAASYVLITPQGDPGARRFWATLDAAANTVTVRTNVAAGASFRVAWLLIG